ncbi:unnamed protein product [Thelazia callipaeda]|uniref:mitogen-activated protein kinase kinase kinase n=1 Tax=Thelazia callipaeda TaxID=103827 RepID=A0A0N5D5K1_THECL|nr:unnamed protein product [Thelazia callipaeda]
MESPEAPVTPALFRHGDQSTAMNISDSETPYTSSTPDLHKVQSTATFVDHPSTSRACTAEPLGNNIPDRPEVFSLSKRKSRSVADVFSALDKDKEQKSIVVESNYDYTPKRKDELNLKRGSTIKVIRRDGEEGWWYGEKMDGSGKKGFFPENHVQLAKGLAKEIDLNDVKFTGLLGAGGFSVVKSAIYQGREVAVKTPHSKYSRKEILEAVREEASIFQMLDHGNIVEMYGVIVGDEPALVLELCRDSLAKVCSSKKNISLSEEIISNWGIQVARGMNYLHSLNVLHRDLKAANVLIKEKVCDCLLNSQTSSDEQLTHSFQAKNGICQKCGGSALNCLTLKIADLGLSKKLRVPDCRMSVVGTIPYLAPEVIRDRKCSKAMDVWSFGLVLWEVLTGATPFEGLGPGAVQLQIGTFVKQKIPSSCPADLRQIIESCWHDDPLQRPTFKDLIIDLENFSNKFRASNPYDQTLLENSLHKLRKSMMEEISAIANEMARKAEELQRREENVKKGERELELKRMIFELQQTLSERPPKEKPLPPKRRQHLKCEDISKPYAMNGDGMDGVVNGVPVNEDWSQMSNSMHVDGTVLGFATLPRIPKKLILKSQNLNCVGDCPTQQRMPSKSTPDLLKLYRLPPHNASPKLKRVNACKVKRDSARTSAEEEVDEQCVEVINDKDLESLLESTSQQPKTSLDHLATPRRIVQLPPSVKKLPADHHVRSSSAADDRPRSKMSREEDRGFFRNIFKRDAKERAGHSSGSLSKLAVVSSPRSSCIVGSSIISKAMAAPSRHYVVKSPTKPIKMGKKKKCTADAQIDKYDLTENSKTFVKRSERRNSSTPSQTNAVYPTKSSPVSVYSSNDELYIGKRMAYEKLSEVMDPGIIENPSYISPKHFPPRDRASTSAATRICFSPAVMENFTYKPPSEIAVSHNVVMQVSLDNPVERGVDMYVAKHSYYSPVNENAPFNEDSALTNQSLLHGVTINGRDLCSPLLTVQQTSLNVPSPSVVDECGTDMSFSLCDGTDSGVKSEQEDFEDPPKIQAPTLPGVIGFRPQRPYTLDLNLPSTPAESGISTSESPYRSFPSIDHMSQDNTPPPIMDSTQRSAPPIPPRINVKRPEDEQVGQRQKLSPVSQSP